jgi:hypothetical protein
MRDVLMLLLIAAFFALCVAYVWWCDQIIGPDPVPDHVPDHVMVRDGTTADTVSG